MADYQLTSPHQNIIIRTADGMCIPFDPNNRDYMEYLIWAGNNTADPYVAPIIVAESISDRQFFQQLAVEGIISQADALASNAAVIPPPLLALIEQLPSDQQFAAKMLVGGATVFKRHHPLSIAIGAAFGFNSAQMDAFWTAADKL